MVQEAVGDRDETMTGIQHYDLIIIGGGPAGQGAAEFAAFAGRRTLVIEREVLGGLVVTTGGGPTKTLREAALHLTGFRYRALYGITEQPDIVMAVKRSRARTEEVSSAMQNFTHSFFVDKLGVDVVYGSARLGPNRTVIVTPREVSETERVFTAEKILIATGSRPFHPANIPFDDPDIFDSEELPKIKRVPKSALVVGGGAIGCEFASIFNAYGIPVTVVHSGEHLLGTMDSELSDLLRRAFEKQGMRIVLGTGVHTAGRINGELQVTLKTGEVLGPDMALFATGRLVDTEGLCFDAAGVKLNPRGVVEVDNHFQTSIEGIYARWRCNWSFASLSFDGARPGSGLSCLGPWIQGEVRPIICLSSLFSSGIGGSRIN